MNKTSFFALAVCCLSAFGQSGPNQLFFVPRPQLRALAAEHEESTQNASIAGEEDELFRELSSEPEPPKSRASLTPNSGNSFEQLAFPSREFDEALYRRLEASGCFTRQEPPSR